MKTLLFITSLLLIATASGQTVTGTGTAHYVPVFTAGSIVANSIMYTTATSVGIGTTAPVAKLEIAAGTRNENIRISGIDGAGTRYLSTASFDYPALSYHAYRDNLLAGATSEISFLDRPGTSGFPQAVRTSDIFFKTAHNWNGIAYGQYLDTTVVIRATQDGGYMGIGIMLPQAKLDVNGTVYCRNYMFVGTPDVNTATQMVHYKFGVNGSAIFNKVVVKTYGNWPDYVFEDSYKLLPLSQVQKYIEVNKHLPDVPSAKDNEKNGIDLADNQATLLKKVEELTLYLIELNKKVEAISKENELLKQKVNSYNP